MQFSITTMQFSITTMQFSITTMQFSITTMLFAPSIYYISMFVGSWNFEVTYFPISCSQAFTFLIGECRAKDLWPLLTCVSFWRFINSIVAHIQYQYPCAFQANCVVEDRIWDLWPRAEVWIWLWFQHSLTADLLIGELLTQIFLTKSLLRFSMLQLFRNVTTLNLGNNFCSSQFVFKS